MPFGFGQSFHTPGCGAESIQGRIIARNAPIGADHAVEAVRPSEQILDDVCAVGIAHIFAIPGILVERDGVVRHDRRRHTRPAFQIESPLRKRKQVEIEVVAGINGIFTIAVVCIPTSFARTTPWPVLDHGVHAFVAPALGNLGLAGRRLKTVDVGPRHCSGEVRIGSEGAAKTVPAGFGGQIDLGRKDRRDAERTVFSRRDFAELPYEGGVEGRSEADRGGPHGDIPSGTRIVFGVGLRAMARVRAVVGRNAEPDAFDQRLDIVIPARCNLRAFHRRDQHMPQVVVSQKVRLGIGKIRGVRPALGKRLSVIGSRAAKPPACRRNGLVGTVEHESGDLLNRHSGGQVLRPFVGGEAPVFVRLQRLVFVQVLEREPVDGEQADARRCGVPQGLSSLVVYCFDRSRICLTPSGRAVEKAAYHYKRQGQRKHVCQRTMPSAVLHSGFLHNSFCFIETGGQQSLRKAPPGSRPRTSSSPALPSSLPGSDIPTRSSP